MKSTFNTIILSLASGVLAAVLVMTYGFNGNIQERSNEELIKDFYAVETAVHVSPHHIRKGMDKGDDSFILVDLRSQEEYEREHIIGAVSIPAYKDPFTSAYSDVERIVGEFKKLDQDKDIIVYCYSIPCMTGRKIGQMLAENDVYVKHLGVGWNEWRYDWQSWNHEHEWDITKAEDYVSAGSEPGSATITIDSVACPIENDFGC